MKMPSGTRSVVYFYSAKAQFKKMDFCNFFLSFEKQSFRRYKFYTCISVLQSINDSIPVANIKWD